MRTVLFREGAPECPLIAITELEPSEVESLQHTLMQLAAGDARPAIVDGEVRLALVPR
jgi:hypothetical protein